MNIVSYRGPGMAGGVSAALARAWESDLGDAGMWWHLCNNNLQVSPGLNTKPIVVANLPETVVQGHYRFCNDFLWPLMHDLPQHARYIAEDYASYRTFNETFGWCLVRGQLANTPIEYFVQDYQLTLLPQFLSNAGLRPISYWHIPWPQNVDEQFAPVIDEMVRGLLNSEAIGFHTEEYARNFLQYVQQRLPEYRVSFENMAIWATDNVARVDGLLWAEPDRYRQGRSNGRITRHITRLVVAPLGIDFDYWSTLAAKQQNTLWHPSLMRTPFILSVDRADYTKGVTDRMIAIDRFFEAHPDWLGRVTFAQICGRTRTGLPAFESYWQECQALYARLKERWSTDTWQPLVWLDTSFAPPELAHAYRTASAMLITAVRDGLNLTAKEYVACQSQRPGVLVLSKGTGAWQELGNHALGVDPQDPRQMAEAVQRAVTMDSHERAWRMALLKDSVRGNTLSKWWATFAGLNDRTLRRPGLEPALRESSR
jgi:trehalose-6-phosphate synthase